MYSNEPSSWRRSLGGVLLALVCVPHLVIIYWLAENGKRWQCTTTSCARRASRAICFVPIGAHGIKGVIPSINCVWFVSWTCSILVALKIGIYWPKFGKYAIQSS